MLSIIHDNHHNERWSLGVARHLHDYIRHQLKEGATDPVFIASEALKDVERTSAMPL
jgi:hypothetical protein